MCNSITELKYSQTPDLTDCLLHYNDNLKNISINIKGKNAIANKKLLLCSLMSFKPVEANCYM